MNHGCWVLLEANARWQLSSPSTTVVDLCVVRLEPALSHWKPLTLKF